MVGKEECMKKRDVRSFVALAAAFGLLISPMAHGVEGLEYRVYNIVAPIDIDISFDGNPFAESNETDAYYTAMNDVCGPSSAVGASRPCAIWGRGVERYFVDDG